MSITTVNANSVSSVTSADLGPSSSLQLMFAKLQLELSETAKSQALERMDYISQQQEEQKLVSSLLNEARQAKADADLDGGNKEDITTTYYKYDENGNVTGSYKETAPKGKDYTPMSAEMVEYMDAHGLAYDKAGNDHMHTSDEWDVAIASLEARLEELGTDTQQQMVYIQDYMGQYNSYLQGANTQISNSNQTLTSLAKGQ